MRDWARLTVRVKRPWRLAHIPTEMQAHIYVKQVTFAYRDGETCVEAGTDGYIQCVYPEIQAPVFVQRVTSSAASCYF